MVDFRFTFTLLLALFSLALTESNIANLRDVSAAADSPTFSVKCFLIQNWNVYDLKGLQRPLKEKEDKHFSSTIEQSEIYYNFCDNVLEKCEDKNTQVMAKYAGGKCRNLAGSAGVVNIWRLINESDPNSGLTITLNPYLNEGKNTTVTWELQCDRNHSKGNITILNQNDFDPTKDFNKIIGITRESCPTIDFYVIYSFLDKYSIVFGAVLILVGIFLLILGNKIINITFFIVACGSTLVITFLFLYQFIIPAGSNPNIVWVVLGISIILGIVIGYFMMKINLIFFIGLGALLGYIVGALLYNIGLNRIEADPKVVYWVTIVVCMLICAALAAWLKKPIVIIATSIVGGYCFIKGISLYAGGFPEESKVMDYISNGEWDSLHELLTWKAYLYLASWLILFIGGTIIQFMINKENKVEDDDARRFYRV